MIKEFKNKNINMMLEKSCYDLEEEKDYFLHEELFNADFSFLPCSTTGTLLLINYRLDSFFDISLDDIKEQISRKRVLKIPFFCSLEEATEKYLILNDES